MLFILALALLVLNTALTVFSFANLRAQVAACKSATEWQARVTRWALQSELDKRKRSRN